MIARNQRFTGMRISLDGSTFIGCAFEQCTLIYSATLPISFEDNQFNACIWEFSGPAMNTINFKTSLYGHGDLGSQMIETAFEAIRKNAVRRPRPESAIILN
jgi:hypothetical protein